MNDARPIDLVRLKLAVEFGVEPDGESLPPPTRNADGHPRLLVSRFDGGGVMFFRHDLPEDTRAQLRALGIQRAMQDEAAVCSILEARALVEDVWRVRWHTLYDAPPPDAFPDVTRQDGRFVILIDGKVAAQAWTVAGNALASEVEVETLEDYRRRGYARQVVAAWAADALAQGKAVFYSHVVDNVASAGVTRSLGLIHLSDEVEYR
ncbi:MAG TPA: GNAT family N-acetyltransferase [Thermomicrobiales bacterium]|nr:GNAT family N-acetyltransferase [Thermomicrobiales bacterium]